MKKIPENFTLIIKALLPLSAILALFIIVVQLGFSQIGSVRQQIISARKEQEVLVEKLDLFREVGASGVSASNTVINGVPDSNPVLLSMSQLKSLAAESNLILRSLRTTGETQNEEVNSTEIAFNIVGSRADTEKFLSRLGTFTPITHLESVKMNESGSLIQGKVVVRSYWAPLPTKLPETLEGFQELTAEENELLTELAKLKQPALIKLPDPNTTVNEAPFGT